MGELAPVLAGARCTAPAAAPSSTACCILLCVHAAARPALTGVHTSPSLVPLPARNAHGHAAQAIAPTYTVASVWASHKHLPNYPEIVAAANDTFQNLPPSYLDSYHNPCWNTPDGRFRCLPYFQILGVSKCGTTDMYHRMTMHPDMVDCGYKVRDDGGRQGREG